MAHCPRQLGPTTWVDHFLITKPFPLTTWVNHFSFDERLTHSFKQSYGSPMKLAHIKFVTSFVALIDFDGRTQLIQIWLANGSNVSLIPKPNMSPLFNVHLTTHYIMVILGEILVWCVSSWHFTLAWKSQYNIVIGFVVALHYLHEEWGRCILHCDIKTNNVMLDANV